VWLHGNGSNAPERQAKVESLELPEAMPMKAETEAPVAMVAAPVAPLSTAVQATPPAVVAKPAAQPAPLARPAPQAGVKPAPAPAIEIPKAAPQVAKPVAPPAADTVKPVISAAQPVPALTQPAVPKPVTAKPAAVDAQGLALIHFAFDNESWVEVKDRNGQTLMAQLNAQGTERYVRGEPPFTLLVGNSGGVRLTYKGKPIDLAPHSSAQVAHLTLE
jgi:cytoskeleton protein RodZ